MRNPAWYRPWYCFLLSGFFVLHIYNEYFGLIRTGLVFKYLGLYILGSGTVLILARFILRTWEKSGLWAMFLLCIYFFFGVIHDFLKEIFPASLWVTYRFLLPLIAILIVVTYFFISRLKKQPKKVHLYLNLVTGVLLVLELVNLGFNVLKGSSRLNNFNAGAVNHYDQIEICDTCFRPDIYFIVFDEYPGSRALKRAFDFDNLAVDSMLIENGFYVASGARSNYNSTPLSLASTFNMDYIPGDLSNGPTTTKSMLQAWYTLRYNRLIPFLESGKYRIVNLGVTNLEGYPIQKTDFFEEYEEKALYYETLLGRVRRDILWNSKKWNLPVLADYIDEVAEKGNQFVIQLNNFNYVNFMKELGRKERQPRFVFVHFMLPHQPYLFDRDGNRIPSLKSHQDEPREIKKMFIGQLEFTNTWIKKILDSIHISQSPEAGRVVVIEGDHGFRQFDSLHSDIPFRNLFSVYFPDRNYSGLYDSISPVNTFRVIMNQYFGAHFPLLKDSSILLK